MFCFQTFFVFVALELTKLTFSVSNAHDDDDMQTDKHTLPRFRHDKVNKARSDPRPLARFKPEVHPTSKLMKCPRTTKITTRSFGRWPQTTMCPK